MMLLKKKSQWIGMVAGAVGCAALGAWAADGDAGAPDAGVSKEARKSWLIYRQPEYSSEGKVVAVGLGQEIQDVSADERNSTIDVTVKHGSETEKHTIKMMNPEAAVTMVDSIRGALRARNGMSLDITACVKPVEVYSTEAIEGTGMGEMKCKVIHSALSVQCSEFSAPLLTQLPQKHLTLVQVPEKYMIEESQKDKTPIYEHKLNCEKKPESPKAGGRF